MVVVDQVNVREWIELRNRMCQTRPKPNLGGTQAWGSLLSAVTSLPIRTVMSGEPEDSKPKLNLVISHSGTRTSSLVRYRR